MKRIFFATSDNATYSTSLEDNVVQFCALLYQEIGTLHKYVTKPFMLFLFSLSGDQSLSEYDITVHLSSRLSILGLIGSAKFLYPTHTLYLVGILSMPFFLVHPIPLIALALR